MNWNFFIGACLLVAGGLLPAGAPLPSVVGGCALAAVWHWKTRGRTPWWKGPVR